MDAMATITVDPPASSTDHLTAESIPELDLRYFTQSELNALSQCSSFSFDLQRTDDLVIPQIDRTVFNESAGSRKQTYSRLRLAPRKPDLSAATKAARPPPDDPERVENLKVVSFFKRLFNPASSNNPQFDNPQLDVFEYRDEDEEFPPNNTTTALELYNASGERKRKRGRKPKTATLDAGVGGDEVAGGENKNKALVVYDENAREREKCLVNKNGVVVDLVVLAGLEDPFGDEIRKRTEGLNGDDELLGFMSRMPGQWGSRRKRRRIVDANEFGDALPTGWKVLIGMRKRLGQSWLFCRRYVSPNGRYFMSCKEVSSYLHSLCGLVDKAPPPTSNHCYQVPVAAASPIDNKAAAVSKLEPAPAKVGNYSLPPAATPLPSASTEIMFASNDVSATNQPSSSKQPGVYKCHRCSTPYYEKNDLLKHLLSCHKRKRRKAGMPLDDFEMLKAGPYDCQFCSKIFYERNVFFAHVGIHVKNYLKGISESGGEGTPTEKECSPVPLREIHPTGSEVRWPAMGVVGSDHAVVINPTPDISGHDGLRSVPVSGEMKRAVSTMGTAGRAELQSLPVSGEMKDAVSSIEISGQAEPHSIPTSGDIKHAASSTGTAGQAEPHSIPISGEINHAVSSMGTGGQAEPHSTPVSGEMKHDGSSMEIAGQAEPHSSPISGEMKHAVSRMGTAGQTEPYSIPISSDETCCFKDGTAGHNEHQPVPISGEMEHAGSSMDTAGVTNMDTTGCNELHSVPDSGETTHVVANMDTACCHELHSVPVSGEIQNDVHDKDTAAHDEPQFIPISGEVKHAVSSMDTAGHDEHLPIPISSEINHTVSTTESNADTTHNEASELPFDKEQGLGDCGVEVPIDDQAANVEKEKSEQRTGNNLGKGDEGVHYAAAADDDSYSGAKNLSPLAEDDGAHGPTVETKSSESDTDFGDTLEMDDDNLFPQQDIPGSSLNEDHEISLSEENNCFELNQTMPFKSELDEDKNSNLLAIDGDTRSPVDDTDIPKLESDENMDAQNIDEGTQGSVIDEDLTKVISDEISVQEKDLTNWSETMLGVSIEPSPSSLPDNQPSCAVEDYADDMVAASESSGHEGNLQTFLFKKSDNTTFDFSSDQGNEKIASSGMFLFPHEEENDRADGHTVDRVCSDHQGSFLKRDDFSVTTSFPTRIIGHVKEPCKPESSNSVAKNMVEKKTKSNELHVHSSVGMFNLSDTLVGNVLDNEGLEKISASWSHGPQGSREISSNLAQQHDRSSLVNDMASCRSSSTAADLSELDRQDNNNGGAGTMMFDFGSGVSGISTGVLTPVHQANNSILESSSAFSLWNNNDQTFDVGSDHNRLQQLMGTRAEGSSRQESLARSSSLSLAGFQQTSSNLRYNLNESYQMGNLENFSRLNTTIEQQPRDTDLMIGFRDTNPRPDQIQRVAPSQTIWRHGEGDGGFRDTNPRPDQIRSVAASETIWRHAEGDGGLVADTSSEQAQVSGAFRSFDFLSDKGDNDVFSMNDKFDSMPSFDGLRSTTVEPMEFSFLTPQDSNAHHHHHQQQQLEVPKVVLPYNNAASGMGQGGFNSSLWIGRGNSMANLGGAGPQPVSTIRCVWCHNEFQQEPIDSESQTGSIGYLCPSCKTGQYL